MPRVTKKFSRRNFLRLAVTTAAAGPFINFSASAFAPHKELKIAKWAHFLPEFDTWFEAMAKDWGQHNNTHVTVDEIPVEKVYAQAKEETSAGKGHDIFIFPWPPAEFQQYAIDHGPIYNMAAMKFGSIPQIAFRSTLNLKRKKYFAFADFWIPCPLIYFADSWYQANMINGPLTYPSLRTGGAKVREKSSLPCGLAFTSTLEGNITTNTMLYAFNGPLINKKGKIEVTAPTVGTLAFAKRLYEQAGTPDQLTWGPGGNVAAMLDRKISCTLNSISVLRQAEKQNPEMAKRMLLQPPLLGSYGVTGFPQVTNCSTVWSFSRNQDVAKQFLGDLIDSSRTGYEKSLGCNFPTYPKTVPNLIVRLEKDAAGFPPDKYAALKDALHWTPNLGAPGLADPIWMETFNTFVIPRMFAKAIKGELNPLDAAHAAEAEIKQIAEKWKDV